MRTVVGLWSLVVSRLYLILVDSAGSDGITNIRRLRRSPRTIGTQTEHQAKSRFLDFAKRSQTRCFASLEMTEI